MAGALLAQCASRDEDRRFRVGESGDALVIVGVAETADNRSPAYSLLWRRLAPNGEFADYDDARSINARTNSDDTVRIRGIPGEFALVRVSPGVYALDSAFAILRERGVNYIAQGLIQHAERPSFEVAPGEAIYIGIWEMDIEGADAATRLWRLDPADLRAVGRASRDRFVGEARVRETSPRAVPCRPQRMNNVSQRQVC